MTKAGVQTISVAFMRIFVPGNDEARAIFLGVLSLQIYEFAKATLVTEFIGRADVEDIRQAKLTLIDGVRRSFILDICHLLSIFPPFLLFRSGSKCSSTLSSILEEISTTVGSA